MRQALQIFVVAWAVLVAVPVRSQEATIDSPIAGPSQDKYIVDLVIIDRSGPRVMVNVVTQPTAGNVDIVRSTFNVPDSAHPTATVLLFLTALDTAVAGETGNSARRANARVLDYLIDHGYLTGVTLVP